MYEHLDTLIVVFESGFWQTLYYCVIYVVEIISIKITSAHFAK